MLPEGALSASHVWKGFRIDRKRPRLREEIKWYRARRRGDASQWRWALRDVDVHINPGDAVALVGTNGSGKSTLLKLFNHVMFPYAGSVEICGRLGALIEVHAGMHPELTGRENVFLYGSMFGLSRRQVAAKLDEVLGFAELEDAADRQVKFYSSGMKMRLGFSCAIFVEPEILLVDEVLAVGDTRFQQKCLDRMRSVLSQGTTVVLVSHDLRSLESICTRGVWIENGMVLEDAGIEQTMRAYRGAIEERAALERPEGRIRILKTEVSGLDGEDPATQGAVAIRLVLETAEAVTGDLSLGISEGPATPMFVVRRSIDLTPGEHEVDCTIRRLPLGRGHFFLWAGADDREQQPLLPWQPATGFDVVGPRPAKPPRGVVRLAPIHVDSDWETQV